MPLSPGALHNERGEAQLCRRQPFEGTSEDFGALATQIREAGLLDRRPGYYSVKIALTVAALAVGFFGVAFVLVGNTSGPRSALAVFLGVMFTQLGMVGSRRRATLQVYPLAPGQPAPRP